MILARINLYLGKNGIQLSISQNVVRYLRVYRHFVRYLHVFADLLQVARYLQFCVERPKRTNISLVSQVIRPRSAERGGDISTTNTKKNEEHC